ncbi:hypothetical protein BpHYR1_045023 [Brachionus plicatilis]|uniref:Uncharacterized protein n=1 Tax=Brachionus plicatilis TaxID=10195 RepID=A0A3M7P7H1_BRAPC|nr:hypothetical protein BpHYR1_045023 [Brachionus plicatilis]
MRFFIRLSKFILSQLLKLFDCLCSLFKISKLTEKNSFDPEILRTENSHGPTIKKVNTRKKTLRNQPDKIFLCFMCILCFVKLIYNIFIANRNLRNNCHNLEGNKLNFKILKS